MYRNIFFPILNIISKTHINIFHSALTNDYIIIDTINIFLINYTKNKWILIIYYAFTLFKLY